MISRPHNKLAGRFTLSHSPLLKNYEPQIDADAKYLRLSAVQFQNQLRLRLLQFGELFLTYFSGFQMDRGIDYEIFFEPQRSQRTQSDF